MENRRSGRTTRIIDDAVQDLFHTGECHVWDHHEEGKSVHRNREVFKKVLRRLQNEHPLIMPRLDINMNELIIKINGF